MRVLKTHPAARRFSRKSPKTSAQGNCYESINHEIDGKVIILTLALKHYKPKRNEIMIQNIRDIPPGNIGFDIDGVVADTMEAFIRMARVDYGEKIHPEEITDFMVEECLDLDPEIIEKIFSRLLSDPIAAGLKPMTGAVETIRDLSRTAPVTFITARPDP